MTRTVVTLAATLLFTAASGPASAVMPNGSYSIDLGGNQSIWFADPDGEDPFCAGFAAGFGGGVDTCVLSLAIDGKGKISGTAQIIADNGDVALELSGPIKGKQKGDDASGDTSITFSIKLTGSANNGAEDEQLSGDISFDGSIDAAGMVTGSWSYSLCGKQTGCFEDAAGVAPETLPDGDWTLALEIINLGNGKLGGDAVATFSGGSQCSYSVSGKYNAKKDESSLKLSSTSSACDGTSLQLKQVRDTGPLSGDLKYKLFGSKGDTFVESD